MKGLRLPYRALGCWAKMDDFSLPASAAGQSFLGIVRVGMGLAIDMDVLIDSITML
jgi:hypothetical protein